MTKTSRCNQQTGFVSLASILQRLRSFPNGLLRGMLYGNEDLELVLLAGNFGDLLLVSIAVRLIVKTIGGIGPDKLDDFSLPRGDRRLRILRRIEPLFEITATRRIETNGVEQSSPIIELNRAVAVSMAEGPEVALTIVDRLVHESGLKGYHLLPSVRGDLLYKLGRYEEARAAFEAAAALAGNRREHDLLRRRAAEAADAAMSS